MARKPTPRPEFAGDIGEPVRPLDGFARAQWEHITAELAAGGIGRRIDAGALTALCEAWGDFDAACAEIEKLGTVVQTERGFTRNPACLNKNQAILIIAKLSSEFGLTPSSRGGMAVEKPREANPFADV